MTTRWSPDTCECVFEYDNPNILKGVVKVCEHHKSMVGSTLYSEVVMENKRKNRLLGFVQMNLLTEVTDTNYEWSFELDSLDPPHRKLLVSFPNKLSFTEKTTLQNFCTAAFGANKVEVA